MMYVLLGATGDILSFLPLLWHESQSGKKPKLMVCARYASVLDGVSYVEPVIFDGDPLDLEGAMTRARDQDPKAVCVQVTGMVEVVKKWSYVNGPDHAVCESFEKEMWRLAGKLSLWKEQPALVFDKRDPAREEALLTPSMKRKAGRKKKTMLVHLDGKTSPFPFKALLWRFLELAFPQWEKVDLGKIHGERIYDLLGLYDRSDLLIAADSACLHLGRAARDLRIIALAKDTPSLWHGTAWRPQHIGYFRYSDFPKRILEFEAKIAGLNGEESAAARSPLIVWSEYDLENQPAPTIVAKGRLQTLGVELGSIRRDSRITLQDPSRYPFVRDVLRLACLKAPDGGTICLLKPQVEFRRSEMETMWDAARAGKLAYAHRRVMQNGQELWHPAIDLFLFPKKWWQGHQEEMPDMVMGKDYLWERVLVELMKKHGAIELPFGVMRKEIVE